MTNHPPLSGFSALGRVDLAASVSLAAFALAAEGRVAVEIGPDAIAGLAASRESLARCIAEDRVVYGVTTGFGPLADRRTPAAEIAELQTNLIYHLASGVGDPLPAAEARGLMLARLLSMLQGASGASEALIALMLAVLNAGLAPYVPEKGTVGASGDLTPSAHVALALMGEGAFLEGGAARPSAQVLAGLGLSPYRLEGRDGLALVNGTSAMTAIAALNGVRLQRLAAWSLALTAAHAEAMRGKAEAWDGAFGRLRPHPGQREAHRRLAALIAGAPRIDRGRVADGRAREPDGREQVGGEPARVASPQDPYTIRCAPQVIGACLDVLAQHDAIVLRELHAVTDNPVFLDEAPFALHGGNFFGQHVAFASDHLANAAAMLAALAERQVARITDEALSGLPPFLQPHRTGLHSGLMGAQVTASALLAEIRTRATPASIQSIPTNANNQDVVSMGTIAARRCRDVSLDLARILSIQSLAVAQAIDIIGAEAFSPAARALHAAIRAISPRIGPDRPLHGDIAQAAAHIVVSEPPDVPE
jgi:tyrosine ammonia-lyase